ncbi:DUF7281 domain-containing protein [Bacteroides bouchesdurhonensis]|uniref:DUF7281 domain-containing protein n=1 Tax=Bacteroides bouchesdurhonensis TaxID=1841855 RepID=UPI00097F8E61|nr:hypothetical protein [Bacteroides bouchesdurhonensis]
MKEEMSLAFARRMMQLLKGERIASSKFQVDVAKELLDEDILIVSSSGYRRSYRLRDPQGLRTYLAQRYDIGGNLEQWYEIKSSEEEIKRSEQVKVVGNSKLKKTRAFRGFLINCVTPIEATLCDEPLILQPAKGTSVFLEDFEHFRVAEDVVVVGMENGESFQSIRDQQYLFEGMKVLFVSRYPQSNDLRSWLQVIPNRYIHFGDFDLAGVSIFLTEYYSYLGDRAEFFIPADVEKRIENGNRLLYDIQYDRYKNMTVADRRLEPVVEMIHRYKRGYEQEGYIRRN